MPISAEKPGSYSSPAHFIEDVLLEHEAAAWLDREHLPSVKWLPADEAILDEIAGFSK